MPRNPWNLLGGTKMKVRFKLIEDEKECCLILGWQGKLGNVYFFGDLLIREIVRLRLPLLIDSRSEGASKKVIS